MKEPFRFSSFSRLFTSFSRFFRIFSLFSPIFLQIFHFQEGHSVPLGPPSGYGTGQMKKVLALNKVNLMVNQRCCVIGMLDARMRVHDNIDPNRAIEVCK